MVEDPGELAADEAGVRDPPEQPQREAVLHDIFDLDAAWDRLEQVPVVPIPVRTGHLRIGEQPVFLVFSDTGHPSDGEAVQPQAVVDARPLAHLGIGGGEHPEAKPRRRDGLEVPRGLEEREHVGEGAAHHLTTLQAVCHDET